MGISGGIKALTKEIIGESLYIDANGVSHPHKVSVSPPVFTLQEDGAVKETSCVDALMLSGFPNYELQNKSVDMISDDDDGSETSYALVSPSTHERIEVPLKDLAPECSSVGHTIDILNNKVIVFPDFILYEDIYSTESRLTFSRSCIRVEGSTVNGAKQTFNVEWAISDIISIESEWWGRVETAMINLFLKPKVSEAGGNANEPSGLDKLKFSVYDPYWFEGQEAIKSLDERYRDTWNVTLDTDGEKDDAAFSVANSVSIPKPHLNIFDEPFEDVIYPKGDPDAVAISKRDVELLQPETFINDTIIDFYIKYLKNKIQPEKQHQFHFFNSFFFRKLADLDKDPRNTCEGRAAFQRVRKWTRKVNLFEKDYIFIPVNYSLHWSLIVICHPGEVANFRDEEIERALKVPCILHMDSIRGSHRGLKNLFQSYLCEEWKERHTETPDDVSSKFSHLRFVPLELPQQENSFDCGLFLLHYVELFLEEVPINFSPFRITEYSNFLNRNWFLPEEASLKRGRIQKLICEILEEQSQQVPKVESINKYPCSQFGNANKQETGSEFLEVRSSSPKMCQGDSCGPSTDIGISLPSASPLRVVLQQIKPGMNSWEMFEPETSARLSCGRNYSWMESCYVNSMSPIEEAEENGEQIPDSSSDKEDYCKQNCVQAGEPTVDDSSPERYISGSQKSSEIGLDDQATSPTSSEDLTTYIVEDSQGTSSMDEGNDHALSDEEFNSMENIINKNNVRRSNEGSVSESDEQSAKKAGIS
ncbi:probable ubiquitin-like-specific protease 2B isoform X3 [Manihot esculenta]|nr:probable ubiquitin-like-specific protease 2B isoform X3 [Manihot esculenta]